MMSSEESTTITVDDAIEKIGFGRFQVGLIVVCGLIQASDSVEMMLLSVLGPAISCEWELTHHQVAFITTGVFVGMLFGSPLWGRLADSFGRWGILMITSIMVVYFGLLSACTMTYSWMVILRLLVGFGVGGLVASVSSLTSEFMPKNVRARAIAMMAVFWSLGSLLMAGMAYIILPTYGWRRLVILAAIPLSIATATLIWVPMSPRYLILSGQPQEALKVLNNVAKWNRKKKIAIGGLRQENFQRGQFTDLFHPDYLLSTLLQWYLWFGSGFVYYGIVLISTEMAQTIHPCLQNWSKKSSTNLPEFDNSCCHPITHDSYMAILVSAVGEFLALPLNFILLDWWGRKPTLVFYSIGSAILFFSLNFCLPSYAVDILLLATRTFCQAVFTANFVYTTEAYPTSIRVLGMGVCSAMARVGAMMSPFVAQIILPHESVLSATLIYTTVSIGMALCSASLPLETRGRSLPQTVFEPIATETNNANEELSVDNSGKNYETFKER